MISIALILAPIFALILAGYLCRKKNLLGPAAASEINRLVVWLALPAALFDITAHTSWQQLYQPHFFLAFLLANIVLFALVLLWQMRSKRHLVDASIEALAATYPNTGFIGFPLLLIVFGADSLLPTTIATVIVVCIVFAIAIALIEAGLQQERKPKELALKVASAVLKNPLIVAPFLGLLCSASGIAIPDSIEKFLKMLGAAAGPCALICIGCFLANKKEGSVSTEHHANPSGHALPVLLSAVKLALQPAITWVFATQVFSLPTNLLHMAVLLSALPTGTGPFMLAEFYRRDAKITSRIVLFSTVASLITLVLVMTVMGVVPH